ncbi:MAG: orotate phosphoribosyltransferase [Limosilactobacillus ingluviei]|nr:orotate phosphoribosyltransferase [Limosilactobacillus ingluviei]MDO4603905.1 orotate phosphoribosyltransferase [Limosilactobacillus ingluviei]
MGQREIVAKNLLDIQAVTLRPEAPFTWASGLKAPIYTDNRLTISYPWVRRNIYIGMIDHIKAHFGVENVDVIAGTATAGIPHATLVAERLQKPLIYVRSKPKDHGQGRQIEGVLKAGQKVVVIDDLLSTGGSVLNAVKAVQAAGGEVLGVVAIFSYELPALTANFAAAKLPFYTVTNYTTLIDEAIKQGIVSDDQKASLHAWRQAPERWSQQQD